MNGRFDNETYDALSPSSGRIILEARGLSSTISLAGLDARGVYNLIEATNYTFNNLSDSSIPVVIKRGEYPLSSNSSLQTLLVSAPGAFVDVHVAMKRYITINANPSALGDPLSVVVDYQHAFPTVPAPVPLYSLTIVTGDDDATVNLLSKPRGGVTRLQQGDGDDQATVSIPELNHTGLLVLDGGGGDNELIIDADGTPMSPTQFESGSSGVTVVNVSAEAGRFLYSNYQRVRVINARMVPPTTTISQIEAVRGRRLDDVTVGSFVNHSRLATPDAFTATIDWGDGVLSAGTIVRDFWNAGRFYITGSHTYHDSPSLSKVTITLVAFGGAFTEVINGVPVAFDLPTLTTTIESPVKVVTEAPVEVSVNSFTDVESAAPVPENFVLATFTQPGGVNSVDPESVGRFAIQVNWGDGSTVMLVRDWPTYDEATETFTVTAPRHTYRTPGTYNVTVIVSWRRADGWPGTVLGSGTGVAHIVDAPLSADSPQPAIPDVVEGSAVVNQVVGSFTDANPLGFAQEFTAMIDWGDGSPLSPGKVIRPGRGGTPFFVVASHLYDTAQPATSQPAGQTPVAGPVTVDGTYPIRIHIHSLHGSSIELSNTITVRDREMVVTGQLDPASGSGATTNLRRPSFLGLASEAAATVFLYATPVGGSPLLIGQATAAAPNGAWSITSNIPLVDGSYKIQAQAYDWSGHSVSALTTITPELVVHRPLILTGQLDPASDSGVSNFDAVTNVVRPNFFGLASEAGATVSLYATPWGGSPILIGQATAAAPNGAWSITSNIALADGGYVIQAQAYNAWGDSTSALTTIAPNLVIDTVGPRINDARIAYFNGRALVVFEDFGGPSNAGTGLDQSTLMDPNNYQFSIFRPRMRGPRIAPRWLATAIQVQPGTSFGGQRATVQINNGRPIPPGRFLLGVSPAAPENPSGVRDVAGNALEGQLEWRLAPANRVPIRPAQPPRRPGGPMALRLATMRGIAGG